MAPSRITTTLTTVLVTQASCPYSKSTEAKLKPILNPHLKMNVTVSTEIYLKPNVNPIFQNQDRKQSLATNPVIKPTKVLKKKSGGFFCCCSSDKDVEKKEFYSTWLTELLKLDHNTKLMTLVGKITSKNGNSEIVFSGNSVTAGLGFDYEDEMCGMDISDIFSNPSFADKHKGFLADFIGSRFREAKVYELCLMSKDTTIEEGKIYLEDNNGHVAYTAITPYGKTVSETINTLESPHSFTLENLNLLKEKIISHTSTVGHTPKKRETDITKATVGAPKGAREFNLRGKNGVFDVCFKLMTFIINKKSLKAGQEKYAGIYTAAVFTKIEPLNEKNIKLTKK